MLRVIKALFQKRKTKLTRKNSCEKPHVMTQEEREDFFKEGSEGL